MMHSRPARGATSLLRDAGHGRVSILPPRLPCRKRTTLVSTNLTEAKSRIQDADFSEESTKLATAQILSQASTATLAQANQSQQGVMNLLR